MMNDTKIKDIGKRKRVTGVRDVTLQIHIGSFRLLQQVRVRKQLLQCKLVTKRRKGMRQNRLPINAEFPHSES